MEFKIFIGSDINHIIEPLAALRINIFNDFPYLYAGDLNYESKYLETYIKSDKGFVFTIVENGKMIGATTCIPLKDETQEVKDPFLMNDYDIEKIFYFGESLLYPEYRGRGIGHLFFDEREKYAKSFNQYKYSTFCAVQRPFDHPMKPNNYRTLDEFWTKRGYRKEASLKTEFIWKDIEEPEATPKLMQFWLKKQ